MVRRSLIILCFLAIASHCYSYTIIDSFDQADDYLSSNLENTIWDGYIINNGIDVTQDSILTTLNTTAHNGVLHFEAGNTHWEAAHDDGALLYVNVTGDFIATVRIVDGQFNSMPAGGPVNYLSAGLMARSPISADIDYLYLNAFDRPEWGATHQFRSSNNGADNYNVNNSGHIGNPSLQSMPWLRLVRVGSIFTAYISADGVDWVEHSTYERSDMPEELQVGIAQATFSGSIAWVEFDDFKIETPEPVYTASVISPVDQQQDVLLDAVLQWLPGDQVSDTGGHDLYLGIDFEAVQNATRSSHPGVDYYNLDESSFLINSLESGRTYYWKVDEVDLSQIWSGDVWSFTTQDTQAGAPVPADGAVGVNIPVVLSWQPGISSIRQDIYFGTDYNEILNAEKLHSDINFDRWVDITDLGILAQQWLQNNCIDLNCADIQLDKKVDLFDLSLMADEWLEIGSQTYKASVSNQNMSYLPDVLAPSQTYYWRVDEYDYQGSQITRGDIWSFQTADGGIIDISNDYFDLKFDLSEGGMTKLQRNGDIFGTNFLCTPGWLMGDIEATYRINSGQWQNAKTYSSDDTRKITISSIDNTTEIDVKYEDSSANNEGIRDFDISQQWILDDDRLTLNTHITNTTNGILEFGDLIVPMPFNSDYSGVDTDTIQTKRVLRHGFFSGNASHAYLTRGNGQPPYLVMTTPSNDTRFEYWDNINNGDQFFRAFVYSGVTGPATPGNWRQQHTTRQLAAGETINLSFCFKWAETLGGVRDILYEDEIDIECVPGMTVPQDLHALLKLRTRQPIDSLVAEYPDQTEIQYMGQADQDTHIYKITFSHLGENLITVNHNGCEQTILEFFSTEPLETLYKKRSKHMTEAEQVVDSSKWYDGLFGEWDMKYGVLRTPDDTDGMDLPWWMYVICCDDPGGAHAPFLAGKNVRFPVQKEIDALEYHIDNYIWGGMQYTDTEYESYAILGVPNWQYNRANDPAHYWRVFDYPHIVMLYYHMYEIAAYYPDMVHYLDADGYLFRAYKTAMRYYGDMPAYNGWADTLGTYNEVIYTNLIKTLKQKGWTDEAQALQLEWENKVKYFIFDKEYPYGSEYAMDSTAFESSHALVKWALENGISPDPQHPEIDNDKIMQFMHDQMAANLAVRGCIEPAYYLYGSDYRVWGQARYTLSYMSQMGGWAVLDYGLKWTDKPAEYIRLGYGSYLSSWALMNTDPTGSNGYWYPSSSNDGAIGWAFKPEKNGPIWLQGRNLDRGIWNYNGEIDLGLCGALRMAKSIVVNDPVFGLFGYGCDVEMIDNRYQVTVKDGLRECLVMNNLGLSIEVNRDAISQRQPVMISDTNEYISFEIENERLDSHTTKLDIDGLAPGAYSVKINGVEKSAIISTGSGTQSIGIFLDSSAYASIQIQLK